MRSSILPGESRALGPSAASNSNQSAEKPRLWTARCVYIIDDDPDIRSSTNALILAAGGSAAAYASGSDFLQNLQTLVPGSILLDIRMPDMDGLQVLRELNGQGLLWPVIIMTGHGDIPIAVEAMQLGAFDFIEKPFQVDGLLECLRKAHEKQVGDLETAEQGRIARSHITRLTGRELEVLRGLLSGMSSQEIADHLGNSPRTVEMQRASLMARLGVRSFGALFDIALAAGVTPLK